MARRKADSSSRTLLRQWEMLRLVPRYPRKVTARTLHGHLDDAGFPATKRTVERDLLELSEVFPLLVDDRTKPHGWSWQRDAPAFSLPGLTPEESLAVHLVQRFLEPLLPREIAERLEPYFRNANQVLNTVGKAGPGSWPEKVRSVPVGQPLLAPAMSREALAAVSDALLRERQLDLRYNRRGEKTAAEMRVHPLALVQRGPVLYLVCTVFKYADIRLLAVHRIKSAAVLDEPAVRPRGFDLDAYIASGALGFGRGRQIRLEAVFCNGAGDHLYETPLDHRQRLIETERGTVRLLATVADTAQLRWWLLAFGDQVEVLRPRALREEFSKIAKALAARYC